jgi:hypothetical protein
VGSVVSDEVNKMLEVFSSNAFSLRKRIEELELIIIEGVKEENKKAVKSSQDQLK